MSELYKHMQLYSSGTNIMCLSLNAVPALSNGCIFNSTPSHSKCAYPSLNHVFYLTWHLNGIGSHISEDEHFTHNVAVVIPSTCVVVVLNGSVVCRFQLGILAISLL